MFFLKDFISYMGLFNTIVAILAALVPASLKLTNKSPEIIIGSFFILLVIFFIGIFKNIKQDLKGKKEELIELKKSHELEIEKLKSKNNKEIDDLKRANDNLTVHKEDSIEKISKYQEYVHQRTAFIEIHLPEIKEQFDGIFEEIQKWQTALRNDMSDSEKDMFISLSKRSISKIIGEERRKNYDDRKNL